MVRLSIDNGLWISNPKLQKLLYFSWISYYKAHGIHLFEEEFQAWKFGPVVPSVYYDNWRNVANILRVPKKTSVDVDDDVLEFLKSMLEKYNGYTMADMVVLSRDTRPWADNYVEGTKNIIPVSDMEKASFTV